MAGLRDIAIQIELHSVEDIKRCFSEGIRSNGIIQCVPLIYELTSEYSRSPEFKECVRAFIDFALMERRLLKKDSDYPFLTESLKQCN